MNNKHFKDKLFSEQQEVASAAFSLFFPECCNTASSQKNRPAVFLESGGKQLWLKAFLLLTEKHLSGHHSFMFCFSS